MTTTQKFSRNAQEKLIHDLVEEMAGENNGRIVDILFGKKDVNEFSIAKKMDLTINQVRNILYKLSADGLVSFIRKKDKRIGYKSPIIHVKLISFGTTNAKSLLHNISIMQIILPLISNIKLNQR